MSRSMFSRRGAWILFVLFGLIPYCIGADGFCTPVTSSTPTDTGTNTGTNTDTGQDGADGQRLASHRVLVACQQQHVLGRRQRGGDPDGQRSGKRFRLVVVLRSGWACLTETRVAIQSGSRKGSSLVQAIWPTAGLSAGTYTLWALVTGFGREHGSDLGRADHADVLVDHRIDSGELAGFLGGGHDRGHGERSVLGHQRADGLDDQCLL